MPVEIDLYKIQKNLFSRGPKLVQETPPIEIKRGRCRSIMPEGVTARTFCNQEDSKGSLIVEESVFSVDIRKYLRPDDFEGEHIEVGQLTSFSREEEIAVRVRVGRKDALIYFCHEPGNDGNDDDEEPIKPLPLVAG